MCSLHAGLYAEITMQELVRVILLRLYIMWRLRILNRCTQFNSFILF